MTDKITELMVFLNEYNLKLSCIVSALIITELTEIGIGFTANHANKKNKNFHNTEKITQTICLLLAPFSFSIDNEIRRDSKMKIRKIKRRLVQLSTFFFG